MEGLGLTFDPILKAKVSVHTKWPYVFFIMGPRGLGCEKSVWEILGHTSFKMSKHVACFFQI